MHQLSEKKKLLMERLAELQAEGAKAIENETEAQAREQMAEKKARNINEYKSNCLSLWLNLQEISQELAGALVRNSIIACTKA